ncbi:MAG: hypothetical protein ABUS48_06390 [Pseudomonadota bacterium]
MKLAAAILSLLTWLSVGAGAANAYCPGSDQTSPTYNPNYYSVANEFARAQYVVIARVTATTWLGEDGRPTTLHGPFGNGGDAPSGFDPYLGAYYDLAVSRVFKGRPGSRLRLFSENTSGRFPLEPGQQYLLFVSTDTFEIIGAKRTIDACGNSAPLESAQDVLSAVERLSPRTSL